MLTAVVAVAVHREEEEARHGLMHTCNMWTVLRRKGARSKPIESATTSLSSTNTHTATQKNNHCKHIFVCDALGSSMDKIETQ